MLRRPALSCCVALLAPMALASATYGSLTTFDDGNNGWGVYFENNGVLGDFPLAEGGNPGANLGFRMVDTFGVNFHNDSNPDVLGNYGRFTQGVILSVDVKVNHIIYDPFFTGGFEVSRPLVLELVDLNPPEASLPYTSVWYDFGEISLADTGEWTTFSVFIPDVTAGPLPAGWGGYGDETEFGEPILPADRTFASVLASVDELRFTTFKPGFFFGFTQFDLQYDNVRVQAVPEPAAGALLLPATALLARRRR